MKRLLATALLALLLACSRESVDRARWQKMSAEDKTLYVRSLLGAEQARAAKGGGEQRTFTQPAEAYVVRIDEAYARGESRDVPPIFEGMAEQKDTR